MKYDLDSCGHSSTRAARSAIPDVRVVFKAADSVVCACIDLLMNSSRSSHGLDSVDWFLNKVAANHMICL